MKNRFIFSIFAVAAAALVLTSCNNKNDEPVYTYYKSIATVDNPEGSINFRFTSDLDNVMSVAKTNFYGYRPETGQRIIAYFTILNQAPETASYDYDVHLLDVYEILTKDIKVIDDDNAGELDEIGDDPYEAVAMSVSNNWLNVRFNMWAFNKTHYINVIEDARTAETLADDGTVRLELRHNADGDSKSRLMWGMASFDLSPYKQDGKTEVKLIVTARLEGQNKPKEYELTYKFDDPAADNFSINLQQEQAELQ